MDNQMTELQPKKGRRHSFLDSCFMTVVLTLVMMFGGQIIGGLLVGVPVGIYAAVYDPDALLQGTLNLPPVLEAVTSYLSFIGIWIAAVLMICIPKRYRPVIRTTWIYTRGNRISMILLGLLIGAGLNLICIAVAWLHGDIVLYFDSFLPGQLAIVFLSVLIQSSAEELLCRGFFYQMMMKRYKKPVLAIVVNALFFASLHLFNNGITLLSILNIAVVGVLFSLMVYYFDSLWCAMAAHAAWNFTQNIVFGLPNSGSVLSFSIFKLDAASAMDSFAYNVGFGVEGTIVAAVVLILACVVLFLWGRKFGRTPTNIWPKPAPAPCAEAITEELPPRSTNITP